MSTISMVHAARGDRRQRGAAAVELALVLMVLLLLGAGIVEFGRALWYYDALAKGTRDAARYMTTVPVENLRARRTEATSIVVASGTNARVPDVAGTVTVACDAPAPSDCSAASASDVRTITVSVSYPFVLGEWIPFMPVGTDDTTFSVTLSPYTTMRYMW